MCYPYRMNPKVLLPIALCTLAVSIPSCFLKKPMPTPVYDKTPETLSQSRDEAARAIVDNRSVFITVDQAVIVEDNAQIRAKPERDADVLFYLPEGTVVDVVTDATVTDSPDSEQSRWLKIRAIEGAIGWVPADYALSKDAIFALGAREDPELLWLGFDYGTGFTGWTDSEYSLSWFFSANGVMDVVWWPEESAPETAEGDLVDWTKTNFRSGFYRRYGDLVFVSLTFEKILMKADESNGFYEPEVLSASEERIILRFAHTPTEKYGDLVSLEELEPVRNRGMYWIHSELRGEDEKARERLEREEKASRMANPAF